MAALTGNSISSTYGKLLQIPSTLSGTPQNIQDGLGNSLPIKLSSTKVIIDAQILGVNTINYTFPSSAPSLNQQLQVSAISGSDVTVIWSDNHIEDGVSSNIEGLLYGDGLNLSGISLPLPLNYGGTNSSPTAVAGGLVYSTSTGITIGNAGTSGQVAVSAGSSIGWTTPVGTGAIVRSESATMYDLTVRASNSSAHPLIVKGASSQTVNLQEWQNSSNTIMALVDNNGLFQTRTTGSSGGYQFTSTNGMGTYSEGADTMYFGKSGSKIGFGAGTNQIFSFPTTGILAFSSSASSSSVSTINSNIQVGISRQASGVLEINDGLNPGTAAYRDLRLRTLYGGKFESNTSAKAYIETNADTGGIRINTNGTTNVGLAIQLSASQSGEALIVRNSSSTPLTTIDSYGNIYIRNSNALYVSEPTLSNYAQVSNNNYALIYSNTTQMTLSTDGTTITLDAPSNCALLMQTTLYADAAIKSRSTTIQGFDASYVPLIVKQSNSHATYTQTWVDNSNNIIGSIDQYGAWNPPTIDDSTALNNSVYYSSTQSKLVYKDSGGTANALY